MGRTNPTYRDCLQAFETSWRGFRRGLRRERQGDFDALFERADRYAAAAGQANPTDPDVAVLLSMLVGHERELRRLRGRVAALEADDDGEREARDGDAPDDDVQDDDAPDGEAADGDVPDGERPTDATGERGGTADGAAGGGEGTGDGGVDEGEGTADGPTPGTADD